MRTSQRSNPLCLCEYPDTHVNVSSNCNTGEPALRKNTSSNRSDEPA